VAFHGSAPTPHACPGARLSAEERRHIWYGASNTAAWATHTIRFCAFTDPAAAADAAWAASDALHVAADVLGSRTLRQAADSYARAARCGFGRIPRPTPAGNGLRATARLLARAATMGDEDQAAVMMLIAKLAELVAAVAELRDAQRHAAQASAARAAAERLHAATCVGPSQARSAAVRPTVRPHRRARTAADLAGLDFPDGSQATPNGTARQSAARAGPGADAASRQPTTKTARAQPVGAPLLTPLTSQPGPGYVTSKPDR
jgi:hypothetical protein